MKIQKIEFENFRNFKDHGEILCSTDGRVTIVYGNNGDGKTTLHQLFQWIFYGKLKFNKTATDKLYNLKYESELPFGEYFEVMGRIEFEHAGRLYSLTRKRYYRKGIDSSIQMKEEFDLLTQDNDFNWINVKNPTEQIEKILPSGLAEYFFFDGENMIADLRTKSNDSASKLKKALYSMFDLDVIESAINHIGRKDLKTTVIGTLFLDKGKIYSESDISQMQYKIEQLQTVIENINNDIEIATASKGKLRGDLTSISEQIGSRKASADYENERKLLITSRDTFLGSIAQFQKDFGITVTDKFTQLLISKSVEDAKIKMKLKIEDSNLPEGLQKNLVEYLLKASTSECICGSTLCEAEKEHLKLYLKLFPPHSYKQSHADFTKTAQIWMSNCNITILENYIRSSFESKEQAELMDMKIKNIDEDQKSNKGIDELVSSRQLIENELENLEKVIRENEFQLKLRKKQLEKLMSDFETRTQETEAGRAKEVKIKIMQEILQHFKNRLEQESREYSDLLEINIQSLIDEMLTTKRSVKVSEDFIVKVTDSFDDETKSEGQFAVVSFAYIGGILKMLKSQDTLVNKEYPLVLDGPFSKLDKTQRQNVIDAIADFAPQVILFSKDDLHDYFNIDDIGYVWTIESNDEKNIARVTEGHIWN